MSNVIKPEYNLRPLWDAILEVYKVFSDICERNNLRYCADTGTALGAIRHGGFIPWDDDLDVQMPRPDYVRLIDLMRTELPKGYAWLDHNNCEEYGQGFGKIIVTDKSKVDKVSQESGLKLCQGIFIDVFPLDGYPDSGLSRFLRRIQNQIIDLKLGVGKLLRILGLVLDEEKFRNRLHQNVVDTYERRARKYPFGSTEKCVSIGVSRAFDDKPYPCKFFGTPKKVRFDSVEMYVQENVDGYLRTMFGDYHVLPPVEARHPGHAIGTCAPWRFGPMLMEERNA